jgi:magnesium chelatase accessory protein
VNWQREGRHWPHRDASRFVDVGPMRWHVQCMGQGPVLLLLHGTGAATQLARPMPCWRRTTVVALDLPDTLRRPCPARSAICRACRTLAHCCARSGAHRATRLGGAGAQFALAGPPAAAPGVAEALLPFDGWLGQIAQPMARALASRSWLPWRPGVPARRRCRLIDATGSELDARGRELYGRLVRSPAHVGAALAMMAGWDLRPLLAALPRLALPQLLHGTADRTVPVAQSDAVASPAGCRGAWTPGHLAHGSN